MWLTAYLLYGAALIVFLGLGRMRARLGYYAPLLVLVVQMVTALAVVMLSVVYLRSTNSTPGLLVVIAAQLPYLASSKGQSARPQTQITRQAGLDLVDARRAHPDEYGVSFCRRPHAGAAR